MNKTHNNTKILFNNNSLIEEINKINKKLDQWK